MTGGFFRVLAALLLVAIAIGLGVAAYNAGVSAGIDEAARLATASGEPLPVGPYGYGVGYGPYAHGPWGFGFGIFGVFFFILGIFLIFGLLRAVFGWGRWGGRGPGGGWNGRREMAEEWHRELHRREADGGRQAGGGQQAG